MSKFARMLWDAFGTLAGALVGTYWLYIAPADHSSFGPLKFGLSIALLAITYAIFFLKVANAVLVRQLAVRQRAKE